MTGSSRSWRPEIGSESCPVCVLISTPPLPSTTTSSTVTGVTDNCVSTLTTDPTKTRTLCALTANPWA